MKSVFFAALFFCGLGCSTDEGEQFINSKDKEIKTEELGPGMSYLALGDSYTIGASVGEDERFPVQLVDSLNTSDLNNYTKLDIVAQTGWTTQELSQAIGDRMDLQSTYDLVTLLIGVNNQYRGYPVNEYPAEFERLLNTAIEFAGGDKSKVVVVSIPDYAYTPFGQGKESISEGIDAYNTVNRQITEGAGVTYIYITDISRRGIAETDLVARDGLHPSGRQYSLWVEKIMNENF